MALNVNNQNYKLGIDASVLKQVSAEILKRAEAKNSQYNVNSTFGNVLKSTEMGVDLYKGNVNTQVAKQIALNNSGLNIQLSETAQKAIHYLNAQAAQGFAKNVEGKMTISVNEISTQAKTDATPIFNSIVANNTSKDKNGSNPFYHGELLADNAKKTEKADEQQSIFG
ncbi:hypothetical protein IKU74_04080 [bacterium]|nr:hypothetical protein [bacterium]